MLLLGFILQYPAPDAQQFLSVEVVDRIVGIAVVVKLLSVGRNG
jgi:hypothetical protein